jgi:hypothetical protein
MDLTKEQQAELLEDFQQWSGGFTPDELHADEIGHYVDVAMSVPVERAEALVFLVTYKP